MIDVEVQKCTHDEICCSCYSDIETGEPKFIFHNVGIIEKLDLILCEDCVSTLQYIANTQYDNFLYYNP